MAQATDYNLANQTGADFRAELNEILAASVSLNSGSSEPTTMYAHQLWVDTSSNVLKIRNAANNAWLTTGVSITASNTFDINAGTINGITSLSFSSGATVASILDEDNLSSDSATALATQQSIKAYVDSQVTAQDLDITDGSSTIAIDLDSETLSLLGGTGITSTASGNGVTFAIGQSVGTSDNVVFNQVTGALVGNASTATTLQTARTISGVSFNGSANITLDTDDIGEGSNKYFTAERVDDQVNTLLTAGANISLTYDDAGGTLTIANTNSADITSVVAGDGLTGGGTSGAVTLAVGVDDSSIEINSDALRVKASGITNAMLGGAIANNKLANSSVTINSNSLSLGGTLTLDTDDIGEGSSNLYYTDARFDTRLTSKTTANLTEGSNLYYTDARANSAIDARVTNTFINNLSGVVADTATALATARTIALSGDVAGSVSFNGTSDVTISSTIQANSVALGTDTTGNYVATITGTANKVSVSGSGSETAGVTLSLPDDVQIADSLTVAGNLTVNGTLTSLDTTNLDIEDNLFQLNAGLTGSPVNDSGMLINRGNQNNGIFMWDESADKFTMGLTTADGTSTGNITLASLGTLVANLEGNVTGNVSGTAATVTGAAQTAITSVGTLTGLTTTGDINLGDNDKVVFGAGSDLQIYSDGTHSRIYESGSGLLIIRAGNFNINNADGSQSYMTMSDGGAAIIYHAGNAKLATTSGGVSVTGGLTTSGDITLPSSGQINASSALYLDSDITHFRLNNETELMRIQSSGVGIGTNSPSTPLHVKSSTAGTTVATFEGNYSANGDVKLASFERNGGAVAAAIEYNDATTDMELGTTTSHSFSLKTADTRRLTIDSSGAATFSSYVATPTLASPDGTGIITLSNLARAGIGDASPDNKVNIKESALSGRSASNGNTSLTIEHATDTGIQFFSATQTQLRFGDASSTGAGSIIYEHSDNNLRLNTGAITTFETGGNERMRVDSSGRLGISTSSPNANLHVGSANATGDATNPAIQIGGAATYRLGMYTSTEGAVIENKNGDDGIQFRVKTAGEAMRLDASGNLGLGTASPRVLSGQKSLTINASVPRIDFKVGDAFKHAIIAEAEYLEISADSDNNQANSRITFRVDNSEKMRLDSSGNVGIGQIPSATSAFMVALQVGEQANLFGHVDGTGAGSSTYLSNNITHNSAFKYINADAGSLYTQASGVHLFSTFASGSAGATATEVPVMKIDSSGTMILQADGANNLGRIQFSSQASTYQIFGGNNVGYLGYKTGGFHRFFGSDGAEKMRLDSSGNLGLGTTPATNVRLDVRSNAATTLGDFRNASSTGFGLYVAGGDTSSQYAFRAADYQNNALFSVMGDGNVGIGTTSPSVLLDTRLSTTTGKVAEFHNSAGFGIGFTVESDGGVNTINSESNQALAFATNGASNERMRLDSSGLLGIGTTSPAAGIHLTKSTSGNYLRMDDGSNCLINFSADTNFAVMQTQGTGFSSWKPLEFRANYFVFKPNNTEIMRLDGGNVQIADSGKLITKKTSGEVIRFERSSDDLRYSSIHANSTDGGGAFIQFKVHTGASATSTADVMTLMGSGSVGIGTASPSRELELAAANPRFRITDTDGGYSEISGNSGHLGFSADAGNSQGGTRITFDIDGSEKMRLDSSGILLLKKTSTSVNVAGGYIDGGEAIMSISSGANTYLVRNTSTSAYSFYVSGAGQIHAVQTSITSLSDERLKDNIVDIDTGLAEVMALKPRKFDWKEGEGSNEKNVAGFVAQEVETVLPDLIGDFKHDDLDDAKSVKMGDMIPTLVKAIQEQQTQIEELKTQIQNLKGE